MTLTTQQWQQGAALASEIVDLDTAITAVQDAIAANAAMTSMSAVTNVGTLGLNFTLSAQSTANILNAVLTELDAGLTALTAQMNALG